MKYFGKLIFMSVLCLLVAILVILTSGNIKINLNSKKASRVVNMPASEAVAAPEGYTESAPALILYSPGNETSEKYRKNLEDTLTYLKMDYESLDIGRTESVSYRNYSMVLLASDALETELKDGAKRLFNYVEEGGRLFWGILQSATDREFQSIYKKMGIMDYSGYVTYNKWIFHEDLLPGTRGEILEAQDFTDVCLFVRLVEAARVYVSTEVNGQEVPMIWSYDYGQGRVACFNGTSIIGDFYKGIAAGCINTLNDTVMYAVINAKCVFLDAFPSPQYESTSDAARKEYNRNVKEFYRDIWWPDMQKAANRLDYTYTGLFVATYNDIVEPDQFEYTDMPMELYYGSSLLRAGHEMGAQGYNYQPLAGVGEIPDKLGYNAWASQENMEASIHELLAITEDLFPDVKLTTYVPPANYLSAEGRRAVKNAMPDLRTISGVYTDEGEEGAIYCQRFEMADDGIAEFPRVTFGMLQSAYERLEWLSALGLHGVFSHFVDPDYIFDEERGQGQNWEKLSKAYETLLEDVNAAAPGLRSLTASEAGEALEVYDVLEPRIVYDADEIRGSLENFRGEAYFYLRTDKTPRAVDDSCRISALGKDGGLYYLVAVKAPEFTIALKEEAG